MELEDLNIMVTRPGHAGEELCHEIKTEGGQTTLFPTIAFGPPPDAKAFQQSINKLGDCDWVIFISPQAVVSSVPAIRKAWPQLPPKVKFAAVGASTAAALRDAGYEALHPKDEWGSEGLLEMEPFQEMDGERVAIVRGEGGRDVLELIFTERGARVMHVVAYHRTLPQVDVSEYVHLLRQHRIDAIVATSFEGVQNLKTLIGADGWPFLKEVPLIVASLRIKSLTRELGFKTIWVADNASHDAIINTLVDKKEFLL